MKCGVLDKGTFLIKAVYHTLIATVRRLRWCKHELYSKLGEPLPDLA